MHKATGIYLTVFSRKLKVHQTRDDENADLIAGTLHTAVTALNGFQERHFSAMQPAGL